MNLFKINDYLTLKLEENKTQIYVGGKKFRQCIFILLNIPINEITLSEKIKSIDEAAEKLDFTLERSNQLKTAIDSETEFWAHCSNLQAWYDYNCDTRLLHRNLAFPLLEALTKIGDPIAKIRFKEEIARRLGSGNEKVTEFLINEGFDRYLNHEEQIIATLNTKESDLIFDLEEFTDNIFIQVPKLESTLNEDPFQQIVVRDQSITGLLIHWFDKPVKSFPNNISNLKNLEDFRYIGEWILTLPRSLNKLSKLNKLIISSKILKSIPDSITKITSLQHLSIRSPLLERIPEKIGDLEELIVLNIGDKIEKFPTSFLKLNKLEYLYINKNPLTQLPQSIYYLESLKELHVDNDLLNEISESIYKLENLEVINIKSNNLKEIPETLLILKHLRILFINVRVLTEESKKIIEKLKQRKVKIF